MNFCKNCGGKLRDGDIFCPKCGAETNLQPGTPPSNNHRNNQGLIIAVIIAVAAGIIAAACIIFFVSGNSAPAPTPTPAPSASPAPSPTAIPATPTPIPFTRVQTYSPNYSYKRMSDIHSSVQASDEEMRQMYDVISGFNNTWVNYVNTGNIDFVFDYLREGSEAYNNANPQSPIPNPLKGLIKEKN